jgi:hypothetical protein
VTATSPTRTRVRITGTPSAELVAVRTPSAISSVVEPGVAGTPRLTAKSRMSAFQLT